MFDSINIINIFDILDSFFYYYRFYTTGFYQFGLFLTTSGLTSSQAFLFFSIFILYSMKAFICTPIWPISELFFLWLFLVLLSVNIFEYNEKRKEVNVKVKNVKPKFLTF